MSLKLSFASLSLGASVDQQTGSLSVFDILEEIRIPQVPVHLQSLVIALALEKPDPNEFSGKILIHILTPDGKQQTVGNGEMRIPAEQKRMKAVFRFGGFPLLMFGSHRFVLSWINQAGAKVGEAILDFDVVQVTQVAQGVAPSEKPPLAH
ncbi:MAG: hypothetical protein A2428_06115 [Bdellovibrionales bacterium RIFOXYC1_FULL_54_43]|nr:MAG: hypothetical protein A2428_06115 [Bdellovibrionales bacterium RIFOXYC1_FULL_54_43]OFZ84828.1 MAG: hypothetical protein A2603_02895 [Bdellovibrionales bacterium RIFOXYD1_FULL_55_31]